jgi:hypothetical protein
MLWRMQIINIFSKCSDFHGSLYLIYSHCWKFTLCQWDGDKDCGEINTYYWIISLCVNIENVEILPEKKFKFKNRFMNKRYVEMSVCSRTSWPHVSRPVPLHYDRGFEPPSRYTALFLYCELRYLMWTEDRGKVITHTNTCTAHAQKDLLSQNYS